jgi:hypothetical protein
MKISKPENAVLASKAIFFLLVVSMLFLTGCQGLLNNNQNYANRQYYIGSEGVRMYFPDSGSPPSRLYYYKAKPAESQQDANTFSVNVKLENRGASYVRGATFVSGYDPGLIVIDGVDIQKDNGPGNCIVDFDIRTIVDSLFGGHLQCSGVIADWSSQNTWNLRISDIGRFIGFNSSTIDSLLKGTDIKVGSTNGNVNFGFSTASFDLDYFNLGKGLMLALSSIDLSRWYGKEYMLHGSTPEYPGGEQNLIEFSGHILNWPSNLDHTTQSFLITNCYAYATYASPDVCIDPNPFSQDRKVCIPQDIVYPNSQGAPVAVTRVQQEATPYSVIFTIYFRNVNKGKVLDVGYLERCSPYYPGTLDSRYTNTLRVWDVRIGSQHLRCTPDTQIVRLDETKNEGEITCTYDLEYSKVRSAYKTPLIIEAWYGYMDTMSRDVYIKRAG